MSYRDVIVMQAFQIGFHKCDFVWHRYCYKVLCVTLVYSFVWTERLYREQSEHPTPTTWWYVHSCDCNICSNLWESHATKYYRVHKTCLFQYSLFPKNAFSILFLVILYFLLSPMRSTLFSCANSIFFILFRVIRLDISCKSPVF